MIEFVTGNLFDSKAQTLVNTINCAGAMGVGVALECKKRFPKMYKDYKRRCNLSLVKVGEPYLYRSDEHQWILNFPTKDHWQFDSRMSYIEAGLDSLVAHYKYWCIESLAMPPLGCGNGKLDWSKVKPLIQNKLNDIEIPVSVYEPFHPGV